MYSGATVITWSRGTKGDSLSLKQRFKHAALQGVSTFGRSRSRKTPLKDLRTFVLLQHSAALGAAVNVTPLVAALSEAVPGAEIMVCGSGFGLEIFRNHPAITRLVKVANPTKDFMAAVHALRRVLPARGEYGTLTATSNERSAIGLTAQLAGARNLVGFTLVPEIYRVPLVYDFTRSQIGNNLQIVRALGHATSDHREPEAFASQVDFAYARSLLQRLPEPARPLCILVTQTSPTQRKSWRPERFRQVARQLITVHGMNVVLVGSEAERLPVERIAAEIGHHALSVAGATNLSQLTALLSLATVGITLDTGTMHIGRAAGLPMVIVAPAWSPALEWLPIDNPRYIILKNLDLPSAPPDYVIDEVSVEEVNDAVDHLLGVYPPGAKPQAFEAEPALPTL